jgi:hypothetical protein
MEVCDMSARAKALASLYRRKKITIQGLKEAVSDKVITEAEYELITGETYAV